MSKEIWQELLEYGRWAPSPHNTQPWLFQLDENDPKFMTLFYDPKRLIPGTNPTGSFMQVGFGILNETLSIAAAAHHLDIEVEYLVDQLDANKKGPQALARLKLVPRKKEELLNRQLILDRRTSRLPYDGKTVDLKLLAELAAIAKEYNHLLEFSSDKTQVDWVVRLNADTMFADMREKIARNEVGSWIRFSRESAKNKGDGLAAYAMQVPGIVMWLFIHANWIFNIPGVYQLIRWIYERSMRGTATVAWISGPFNKATDWEQAGHMMARIWLTMTKYGVYLHPFGSVITNNEAHKKMDEHFKNDSREHDLWMLMRLGYGELPPQAQRLPLEQMIIKDKPFNSSSKIKIVLLTNPNFVGDTNQLKGIQLAIQKKLKEQCEFVVIEESKFDKSILGERDVVLVSGDHGLTLCKDIKETKPKTKILWSGHQYFAELDSIKHYPDVVALPETAVSELQKIELEKKTKLVLSIGVPHSVNEETVIEEHAKFTEKLPNQLAANKIAEAFYEHVVLNRIPDSAGKARMYHSSVGAAMIQEDRALRPVFSVYL